MRFARTSSIGFSLARSLTLVGLMRVSIGPAIRVMDARLRGIVVLGHDRGGDQRLDAGLADRDDMGAGAEMLQKADDMGDIFVEAERPVGRLHVAGVVPVGDIDVVIGQQRMHGRAQQRGEMAGQRRHHQHARLLASQCPS